MKTIWVTGAKGQLGVSIAALAKNYPDSKCLYTDVAELDITDAIAVANYMAHHRPQVIINTAAYTQVDKAEEEATLAAAVNAVAVGTLAREATLHNALLLHVSTDFVFDGTQGAPYTETDTPKPLSVYGQTKLDGEKAAMAHAKTIIIRTAWVYAPHGKNFLQTMLRLGKERDALSVVADQMGTPTYTGDLAAVLLQLAHTPDLADKYGCYHYTHEGVATWYDFAVAIMDIAGIDCAIKPIPTKDYPTPAMRPANSYLSKEKIKAAFSITIPHWRKRLQEVMAHHQ